jgi:glucose-1-phosphate thymidylyltransferase
MKGVALCGGNGTRLNPLTKVTNKHLLPVYNKPMVYYPIETLVNSGIKDILLVCGGNAAGDFLTLLGNGEAFGLKHLHYTYQSAPKGIADALGLAEEWASGEPITVILADNIFEETFKDVIQEFEKNPVGGVIFGTRVARPEHYGVICQDENGNITKIVEKPKQPTSDLIATGLYIYDSTVWEFLKTLTPSARGELEITDVNNYYLNKGQLKVVELKGSWGDCGEDFDSYMDAGIKSQRTFKSK